MTAETPRTTALRKILPSVGTSEELCLQLAGELEQELNGAREAADAATQGVYSATMLEAAKVSGTAQALRLQINALNADLAEALKPKLYLRGHHDDGTPFMGTADEYIADLQHCLDSEAQGHDEARRDLTAAREQIAELDGAVRMLGTVQTQLIAERNAARARVAELEAAVRKACQALAVAYDWDLYEIEIDHEMVRTADLQSEFRALLSPSPEPTK